MGREKANQEREWTPEMRAKVAESVRRYAAEHPDSAETREKKGAHSRGKPKSEETRRRMSEGTRAVWASRTPEERSARARKGAAVRSGIDGLAEMHRRRSVRGEKIVAGILTGAGISYSYQHVVEEKYIVDFYLPDLDWIIEVDEPYHREPNIRQREEERKAWLNARYKVFYLPWADLRAGRLEALFSILQVTREN